MTERYAHEVVPTPGIGASLAERARYHHARARGFYLAAEGGGPHFAEAVRLCTYELHLGLLYYFLDQNPREAGEAANRAALRLGWSDDVESLIYEQLEELGVDPKSIRAYELGGSGF